MDSSIFKKANEFLGAKSKHRKWQIAVTALAALVIITTAYFLSKPAQTLTKDPNCGIEEHTHTEECYTLELVCGYEDAETLPSDTGDGAETQPSQTADSEAHQHGEDCYVTEQQLICGQEENAGHVHTDACKTVTEVRELTCGQEESAGHTHTDACKTVTESRDLTCGQEESAEHSHTDACYTVNQTEAITCGQEESAGHTHTDACYTVSQREEIICGQEEGAVHTHTEACYETVQKLVCDKTETGSENADSQAPAENATDAAASDSSEAAESTEEAEAETEAEPHVHTEECYAEVLTCRSEEHTHSDECRQEVFCGITAHTHGASCYDEDGNLICEITEHRHEANCYKEPHCGITAHVHGADCYDEEGNLTCELEEHTHTDECYITNTYFCTEQIHAHSNDCYDLEGNLICGSADYLVHSHSESCYDKNERLICTLPEREAEEGTELHTHTEECYGVRGVLICGQTEVLSHDHDDNCRIEPSEPWFDTVSAVAYCGMQAHNHKDACKDSEGNLICGLEEHTHTEECYEETGYGCIHEIHVHEADCYDAEGNLICGLADYVLHTHDAMCYGMNGKLLCTLPEIQGHVHNAECYTQEAAAPAESEASAEGEEPAEGQETEPVMVLTCTLPEAHEHTEACRDENGNLICGKLQVTEHVHTEDCIIEAADIEITQTYTGADFIVTATYNKKAAELPEDAQLFAARIREEGNEAYFAERAAQYEEAMGEGADSTMQALMQIGFLYEGAEAEPKAPVTIKVQFLDENGLPEGSPVTVVHFGENGNETIQGTDAEKNSTTFQMNSFSEIALGWKKPVQTVEVDQIFTYEDDAFTVTFHVEGEAVLPTEEEIEEAKREKANETVSDGDAEGTVSDGDAENGQDAAEAGSEGEVTNEDLEAVVEPLGEDAAEYEAALGYAAEADIEDEILSLQVLSYGLTYEGAKLDLTGCKVTVEVTPTDALVEFAEGGEASVMAIGEGEAETEEEQNQEEAEVFVVTMDSQGAILDTLTVGADASMVYETTAQGKDNAITAYAASQANPNFIVQYYANIKSVVGDGDRIQTGWNKLNIYDTSGKQLPTNEKSQVDPTNRNPAEPTAQKFKHIYLDASGNIQYKSELTQMYKPRKFEYIKAPSLMYFNALVDNAHYELSKIQIIYDNEGRKLICENTEEGHIHDEDACYEYPHGKYDSEEYKAYIDGLALTGEIYDYNEKIHFTNREVTAENHNEYILIRENAVIRLIYDVTEKNKEFEATFYDYDVSDGKIYHKDASGNIDRSKEVDRTKTPATTTNPWYMYSEQQGINNANNYSGIGNKLAFGNSDGTTPTTLGAETLGNYYLNQANMNVFRRCSFGIVQKLENNKIVYSEGVVAPNLFNEGDAIGKTTYPSNAYPDTKYPLVFIRKGDTYTLTAVKGTKAVNLQCLPKHMNAYLSDFVMYSNEFWPMDDAPSAGTPGHDPMFGTSEESKTKKFFTSKTEAGSIGSDYGESHNAFFGMMYAVEFDLGEDYVGPLEYYFFGDDDMWVFLDDTLVCDIGGVHQSVGEYVNLWDYLEDYKTHEHSEACYDDEENLICGKHRLTFFYTERGASGSTCWMQFTLPSVTSMTPEQSSGQITNSLKVGKEVIGTNAPTNLQYEFSIHFTKNDADLPDDYSYTKYDKTGRILEYDIIIWDGGTFTLGNGEYVMINYLPVGTTYEIKETGNAYEYDEKTDKWILVPNDSSKNPSYEVIIDGEKQDDGIKKDEISETQTTVNYINDYGYSLPETGGSGTTTLYALACVLSILSGAGLVYRKKFRERRAS